MAEQPASLDDMMLALQRADSAGNVGDATKIAQMIQETYPRHVHAALDRGPPTTPPPLDAPVSAPSYGIPMRADLAHPIMLNPPQLPDLNAPSQSQGAAAQGAGGGGVSGPAAPAPAGGAPSAPAGGIAASLGTDLSSFARNWVGALPGGNWLAAGAMNQGPIGTAINAAMPAGAGAAVNALGGALGLNPAAAANKANIDAQQQQATQDAPVSGMLGNMVGTGVTLGAAGVGLGAGAAAAGASGIPGVAAAGNFISRIGSALGGVEGGWKANAARQIATGAIGGVGQTAADVASGHTTLGDALPEGAVNAALGAVAGPVLGRAASKGWELMAGKLTDLVRGGKIPGLDEATAALFKTMKVDPEALAATHAQMVTANGGQPVPLAAVLPAYAKAEAAKLAGKTADLGNVFSAAADKQATDAQTHVPAMLNDLSANTPAPAGMSPTGSAGVQTVGALESARDATMNDALRGGPNPVANQRIQLTKGDLKVLDHPGVNDLVRGDPEAQGALATVKTALANGQPASLNIDLLDSLRQDLSKASMSDVQSVARPARQAFNGIKTILSRNQDYSDALGTYAQHNAVIQGFNHGQTGEAIPKIKGAMDLANDPVTGAAYKLGHGSGLVSGLSDTAAQSPAGAKAVLARLVNDNPLNSALAQAHGTGPAAALAGKVKALDATTKAINQIAPGGPVGEAAGHVNGNAAAHMFAAAATHNPHAATSNGIRLAIDAIGLGTNRLSPAAADQMASALLTRDPVKQQQVINLLRAKGASEKNLAILRAYTGAAAGAVVPKAVIGQ